MESGIFGMRGREAFWKGWVDMEGLCMRWNGMRDRVCFVLVVMIGRLKPGGIMRTNRITLDVRFY